MLANCGKWNATWSCNRFFNHNRRRFNHKGFFHPIFLHRITIIRQASWIFLDQRNPLTTSPYFQVLSLFVMGSVSITDSIAISFFSNYMLNEWETSETNSGWMMTVASLFYTVSTFLSGFIGSKRKVCLRLGFQVLHFHNNVNILYTVSTWGLLVLSITLIPDI